MPTYRKQGELRFPDHSNECALNILEGENTKCSCPTLVSVTKAFSKAHADKADAETRMAELKVKFFGLLKHQIPRTQLAQTTVYYDGDDPEQHVATLYPKWSIVSQNYDLSRKEWRILIQEDVDKKPWRYVNPIDKMVYERQVRESAPAVDLDRLKKDHPSLYKQMTFQPRPPRELKPLDKLTDRQKATLIKYLLPVKLTEAMSKPRPAKPEELEELVCKHPDAVQDEFNESTWFCPDCEETFLP
jgi:hypothetical protein